MEERYLATTQNRFYPDMSNVNKNITVKAKLISPPTYLVHLRPGKQRSFAYRTLPVEGRPLPLASVVRPCEEIPGRE